MNDLKEYFHDILGYDINIVPANNGDMNRLPLFIRNKYTILVGYLFNRSIVFLHTQYNHPTKLNEFQKHIDIVRTAFNLPVVYVCESMKGYNRKRFIQKGISFIVPGKQMFMPELLIDIQDFAIKPRKIPEAMTPAIQYFLIYHLMMGNLEGMNFKDIAQILNLGTMTVTRAANYLTNKQICTIVGTKDKYLNFDKRGLELWKVVEPLMQNPVKSRVFTSSVINVKHGVVSGINALAHYTDLADENKPYYAVNRSNYNLMVKENTSLVFDEVDGEMAIEIWKYDPTGLSKDIFVDPLSLYLMFRDDPDERIQIAINQMLEDIKW